MLDVRICLLLLLEAGIYLYTSHAVTLPSAYSTARDDNLSLTRSIRVVGDHAFQTQQSPFDDPIRSFGTFTYIPQYSVEQNGSLYAHEGRRVLDATGPAGGAFNTHTDSFLEHLQDADALPARGYAFTETQEKTLRPPNESVHAISIPTVGPGDIITQKGGAQSTDNRKTSVTADSLPLKSEAVSALAEAHKDRYEPDRKSREAQDSFTHAAFKSTEEPLYSALDTWETRRAPVPLSFARIPRTALSTPWTAVQVQGESSLPSNNNGADELTAEARQVVDANKTEQIVEVSPARQTAPSFTEETNGQASAATIGENLSGGKSDLRRSILKDARHAASAPAVQVPAQFVEVQSLHSKKGVTAAASDTSSQQHRISKHDAQGNQPVEEKLAQQGPDLSKHETQYLVDPQALAQEVRKFVGLRAGSNLHLETQKLIEKNCDISTFGPSYCASKANPNAEALLWSLEHRKNTTCFVIALVTLAFGVLVQTLIRLLENRISQGKDEFSKEVMETAFRQIATISIVNVLLWGAMQSNLASVLDQLIFGDVIPKERDSEAVLENVSPMLEVLFEELFFVAVILLVWYVLYVLIFQCLTRQLIDWMRRVDEEGDIPEVARQAEIQRKRCCGWLLGRKAIDKANFIAHRYEFGDNVQAMSVPGVDPTGYYFMEYLRAALLRMAIEMIRLPNSTLIFLMFVGVCLRPLLSFRLSQEVALVSTLSSVCLFGMLLVWAYVYRIERQLRPRHIPQYLVLRYHMDVGGHSDSYVEQFTPPYKLQKQKDTWPGLMSLLYGTTLPNKHQQLFCFWANGPALVLRALEATFFCQLLVLAWWVQLVRNHPATWLRYCWWGNLIVGACALIQFGLLKNVVYTVLVALNSGLLIEPELLEKVWDMQRAENMRLIVELTDALRVQSTLYAINEGGDIFWRQLLIRSKSAPRQAHEQRLSIWAGLDEEQHGEINREKVFRYLSSQGLPVKSEADVSDFLQVFDRDGKGGLNEDEFFVLVMIVKQMLMEPLDKDALRALFENEYGIPWTSAVGIDMPTLSKILNKLHLVWSEGKKRYLFDFVGGRRGTTSVSPDQFVTSLQAMDEQAMQPFQADLTGRHADSERFS